MITFDTNKLRGAVGFTMKASVWGNRRKANIESVQTDADKKRMKLSKELIRAEEYDAIKSYIGELRQWVYQRTVPSFFREGFQLASLKAVSEIEGRMKKARVELAALVDKLVEVYPARIEEARVALNSQFNPGDYPPADVLRQMFDIDWNWISFTIPDDLPAELKEAEANKLQQKFKDAGEQITEALRVGFQELIKHAADKLKPGEDGKPKIFRDTLIGNIQEFIDTFQQRDLMNDVELQRLVDKAQEILIGVSPEDLRKNEEIKESTRKEFESIASQLDAMIVTKKGRVMQVDDDAAAA